MFYYLFMFLVVCFFVKRLCADPTVVAEAPKEITEAFASDRRFTQYRESFQE